MSGRYRIPEIHVEISVRASAVTQCGYYGLRLWGRTLRLFLTGLSIGLYELEGLPSTNYWS